MELIPAEYYSSIFFNFLLMVTFVALVTSGSTEIGDASNLKAKNYLGIFILILLIFFLGLRPISGKYFGDTLVYATVFKQYQEGAALITDKDIAFQVFLRWSGTVMTISTFFLICMTAYILPLYYFSKKIFKEFWFYSFLILVLSFSFYGYGTNGVRNGIATSFFLLAISCKTFRNKLILFLLAFGVHKSALILILAYYAAKKIPTKVALIFWAATIPLSIILSGFWESFFLDFAFGDDDRLAGYLAADSGGEIADRFSRTGFRWDFILYSLIGVGAGYYFIYKKKYEDSFYSLIYVFYLLTNGFWILINQATYSNRFAYLSWFIMGPIVIYPLLKMKFFERQHLVVGCTLALYFVVTYTLSFILPAI